jgi:hypothetical protein
MYFFRCGWILLFLSCFLFAATAQEVRTNEEGEKIIVYPDGSWQYFHEALEEDPAALKTPAERQQEKAILLAEELNATAYQLKNYLENVSSERALLEEDLGILEAQDLPGYKGRIQGLQLRLEQVKKREGLAKQLLKEVDDLAIEAEAAIYMKTRKRDRLLKSILEEKAAVDARLEQLSRMEDTPRQSDLMARDEREYTQYDPQKDLILNPPKTSCQYAFNGVDKFTGKWRVDVAPQTLFSFTPKQLRQFLRDREYMECKAYMSAFEGGMTFLGMEFVIASSNASSAFGGIEGGSVLSIRLMNGETLQLINTKTDKGTYNSIDDTYTYRAQYRLTSYLEKALADSEVDMIRVIWKTGYEDYEIYELDFFRDQMKCLQQAVDR